MDLEADQSDPKRVSRILGFVGCPTVVTAIYQNGSEEFWQP